MYKFPTFQILHNHKKMSDQEEELNQEESIFNACILENIEANYPDIPLDMVKKVLRTASVLNMTLEERHSFLDFIQKLERENNRLHKQNPIKQQ